MVDNTATFETVMNASNQRRKYELQFEADQQFYIIDHHSDMVLSAPFNFENIRLPQGLANIYIL